MAMSLYLSICEFEMEVSQDKLYCYRRTLEMATMLREAKSAAEQRLGSFHWNSFLATSTHFVLRIATILYNA